MLVKSITRMNNVTFDIHFIQKNVKNLLLHILFRDDMKKQSDRSGPVQHKVPKSSEPPLRVWLRDYFWLAVAAWAVLASVLFGFFGLAILGVTKTEYVVGDSLHSSE